MKRKYLLDTNICVFFMSFEHIYRACRIILFSRLFCAYFFFIPLRFSRASMVGSPPRKFL